MSQGATATSDMSLKTAGQKGLNAILVFRKQRLQYKRTLGEKVVEETKLGWRHGSCSFFFFALTK